MQLIGQKNNLDIINRWDNLPSFLIIQGPRHSGKTYLTTWLCEKYGLYYMNMNTGVGDIRSLISAMKPNSNMLYHFKDLELSSLQAKNALLKITEEPIPGNYVVITGGSQIKTLESRAKKLIMEPYSYEDVSDLLKQNFDDKLCSDLFLAGFDTPAKITYYSMCPNCVDLLKYALEISNEITYISAKQYIPMIYKFQDRYVQDKDSEKPVVDECMLFLDMLINIIDNKLKTVKKYSYFDILSILIESKYLLQKDKTLRRRMLLYKTFYDISCLSKGLL